MNFSGIAGRLLAAPIFAGMLTIEVGKLAYQASAYATEIVYDGIRHGDWYL